jgi:hypothetical protein
MNGSVLAFEPKLSDKFRNLRKFSSVSTDDKSSQSNKSYMDK